MNESKQLYAEILATVARIQERDVVLVVHPEDETAVFADEEEQEALEQFFASSFDEGEAKDAEDADGGDYDIMLIIAAKKGRRASGLRNKAYAKRRAARNAYIASRNAEKRFERDIQNHAGGKEMRIVRVHKLEKWAATVTGAKKR